MSAHKPYYSCCSFSSVARPDMFFSISVLVTFSLVCLTGFEHMVKIWLMDTRTDWYISTNGEQTVTIALCRGNKTFEKLNSWRFTLSRTALLYSAPCREVALAFNVGVIRHGARGSVFTVLQDPAALNGLDDHQNTVSDLTRVQHSDGAIAASWHFDRQLISPVLTSTHYNNLLTSRGSAELQYVTSGRLKVKLS